MMLGMTFNGNSCYGASDGNDWAAFTDGTPRYPVPLWDVGAWPVQDRGDI